MPDTLITCPQVKLLGNQSLPVLRWLLRHTDAIQPLVTEAIATKEAADVPEAWTHIKAFGDIVVPIYGDFPSLAVAAVYGEGDYENFTMEVNDAYGAHGEIIKILIDNLPAIMDAFMKFWTIFGGK